MSDSIDQLRNIKAPLWARIVGRWRRGRVRREDEARHHKAMAQKSYICTVNAWTWWTDTKHYSRCWFMLYEDGYGKRTFEYGYSSSLLNDYRQQPMYANVIVPWINGNYNNKGMKEFSEKTKVQPDERQKTNGTD